MRVRHFLNSVEHARIHGAIQAAERGTSGRIVVYVTHERVAEALPAALPIFRKLDLEGTGTKAGLLIFLAPKSRKFAVLGGTALHDKLGQSWWDELAGMIENHFRKERYTEGLLAAIGEVSHTLKTHFPAKNSTSSDQTDIIED